MPQLSYQSNGDGKITYLIGLCEGQISQYINVFRTVPGTQYVFVVVILARPQH